MVGCELRTADLAEGEDYKMVGISFLPASVTEKIDSGVTDLVLQDAMIVEATDELTIAPDASYQVSDYVLLRYRQRSKFAILTQLNLLFAFFRF